MAMVDESQAFERTRSLVERAIQMFGSEAKLGKAIGRSQNAVWQAKRRGRVTAEMAIAIDEATEGVVSRHQLRPDIFRSSAGPSGSSQAA